MIYRELKQNTQTTIVEIGAPEVHIHRCCAQLNKITTIDRL